MLCCLLYHHVLILSLLSSLRRLEMATWRQWWWAHFNQSPIRQEVYFMHMEAKTNPDTKCTNSAQGQELSAAQE